MNKCDMRWISAGKRSITFAAAGDAGSAGRVSTLLFSHCLNDVHHTKRKLPQVTTESSWDAPYFSVPLEKLRCRCKLGLLMRSTVTGSLVCNVFGCL